MMTYGDLVTNTERLQNALEENLKLFKHATSIKTLLEDEGYELNISVKKKGCDFDGDSYEEYGTDGLLDKNEIKDIILKRVNKVCENTRKSLETLIGVSETDKPVENTDKPIETILSPAEETKEQEDAVPKADRKKGRYVEQKISDKDLERAYFVDCKNVRLIERETGESYWSLRRRLQVMQKQKEKTAKEGASSRQEQMDG